MTSTMFNFHSIRKKVNFKNLNWLMYLLIFIFLSGLAAGAFCVKKTDNYIIKAVCESYMDYLFKKFTLNSVSVFLNTLLLTSTAIIFSYFIGLCAIGIPFVMLIPAVSGALIGIISGFIYENYLLKGLGYCAILIFPAAAISVSAIIFSCKESLQMSKNMLMLLSRGRVKHEQSFKKYNINFLVYTAIITFASAIESILTKLFIGLFDFKIV